MKRQSGKQSEEDKRKYLGLRSLFFRMLFEEVEKSFLAAPKLPLITITVINLIPAAGLIFFWMESS